MTRNLSNVQGAALVNATKTKHNGPAHGQSQSDKSATILYKPGFDDRRAWENFTAADGTVELRDMGGR